MWQAVQEAYPDSTLIGPEWFGNAYKNPDQWRGARQAVYDDLARSATWPEDHDVFIGAGGDSSLQLEKAHDLDMTTVTAWFSTHHDHRERILRQEYQRYRINQDPIHAYQQLRAEREVQASDHLIVPGPAALSTYPDWAQDRAYGIHFGVDTDQYHPPTDREWMPNGKLRILCPLTNPWRKGLADILQAWQALDYWDYELTITGGWDQVQNLPGRFNITAPGWVDTSDLPDLYRSHDVMLLPSLEEGMALATLESMACGTPIIVTPQTGVPIDHGEQGLLVNIRDPHGIHDALTNLHDEPDQLTHLSKNARQYALEHTWADFRHQIEDILHDIY